MTAILGFAETLVQDELTEEERSEATQAIYRNGEYLLELLNDVLDLSKMKSGKMEVEMVRYSLSDLLEEVMGLMVPRASAKCLQLDYKCNGPVPEAIRLDSMRTKQILINLIGNALKFTQEGRVRVTVEYTNPNSSRRALYFDVSDTGVGMTAEETERIFDPFRQADRMTTRKFGGTGLGLAISSRFADMMGGKVELLESSPAKGSIFRFTLYLPLDESVDLVDLQQVRPIDLGKIAAGDEQGRLDCKILLAEDGEDNRRLFEYILRRSGATVVGVENGKEAVTAALEAARSDDPFDLILMDMQMPVMSGYEATAELRKKHFDRPIIALTAALQKADRERSERVGCDLFISKPIKRSALLAIVREVTKRRPSRVPAVARATAD